MQLGGLIGLALLVNVAAAMWSAGIALRFRSIQAGPLMQTPSFLILFLAPVYVPLSCSPSWIHAVAQLNPITPIVEAQRNLIAGSWTGIGVAILAGVAMVTFFLAWASPG